MISRQQRLMKRKRRTRFTFFCFVMIALAAFSGFYAWSKEMVPGEKPLSAAAYGMEPEDGGGTEETPESQEITILPGDYGAGQADADPVKAGLKDGAAAGESGGDTGETGAPEGAGREGADGTPEAGGEDWKREFYPVPASPKADDSYFSDAVFIGDSRVQGLMIYSGLKEGTFYAEKSMSVNDIMTKKIVAQGSGSKISVTEALRKNQFRKVYIKLGLNELGSSLEGIVDKYSEIVDEIKELEPEAIIYVQAVIPVTKSKSQSSKVHNNPRIQELNELLKKMSWEKGLYYLDTYTGLADADGCLPKEASSDGVHLNKTYCRKWLEYLKNHTVKTGETDL